MARVAPEEGVGTRSGEGRQGMEGATWEEKEEVEVEEAGRRVGKEVTCRS